MISVPSATSGWRRFVVGVVSQGMASLSNLLVALLVAALLGPESLGRFSVAVAAIALVTAFQTAWVGDTFTVLGSGVHAAALWWHHRIAAVTFVAMLPFGRFVMDLGWGGSVLLAALAGLWLYEEYGRRRLMAELRFGAQGLNDLLFAVVAVTGIAVAEATGALDLPTVFLAMLAGAVVAVVHAQLLLPAGTRVWSRGGGTDGRRDVLHQGFWRAAQSGIGTAQVLVVRLVVAGDASLAALGNLEAARLVAAPLMTALAGIGSVLLSTTAADRAAGARRRDRPVTGVVTAVAGLYAVLALWQTERVITALGGDYVPDRWAVGGWLTLAVVLALTQAHMVRSLVELPARTTFVLRVTAAAVGGLAASAAVWADVVSAVPFGFALGAACAGVATLIRLRRGATKGPGAAAHADLPADETSQARPTARVSESPQGRPPA